MYLSTLCVGENFTSFSQKRSDEKKNEMKENRFNKTQTNCQHQENLLRLNDLKKIRIYEVYKNLYLNILQFTMIAIKNFTK